jgi:carbonic anhydrase
MELLLEGYRRFRVNGWPEHRKLLESLAKGGQQPKALVLTCIDSRVDPAMIFDAHPGQMLTARNVANLAPPYMHDRTYHGTSAALEFGVRVLGVPNLIVLGHGLCGGVQALLKGAPQNARDFVEPWMSLAAPARERALATAQGDELQRCCEHEVVKLSLANLMTFPWIAERVEDGALHLHGAWFDIGTGELMTLQEDGRFEAVR